MGKERKMKRGFFGKAAPRVVLFVALVPAVLFVSACETDTPSGADDTLTGYTVTVNGEAGVADSTRLVFAFSADVAGLAEEEIQVAGGAGEAAGAAAVIADSLTGGGKDWSLWISVESAGEIRVGIVKAGIDGTVKPVTAHKAAANGIGYTAMADGGNGTEDSTHINFVFNADVTGLAAGDIEIANGAGDVAGAVTQGSLTGSGQNWSLGIGVQTAGGVRVRVSKADVDSAVKTVAVFKAGEEISISYRVTVADTITGGSVSVDPETANIGGTVTLTVTPADGFRLKAGTLRVNGSAEGITTVSETTYTFTMPAVDVTVTAEFEAIPNKTALSQAIAAAGEAKGAVTVSVDGADIGTDAFWVTQAVMTAFEAAIAEAQALYGNAAATQAEVDAGVTALTNAAAAFNNAKAAGLGTLVTEASFTALSADGSSSADTTKLTLKFDRDIEGFHAGNITITPEGKVTTGGLTRTASGVYELEVTGVMRTATEGTGVSVTVSVGPIAGYTFDTSQQTTTTYATYIGIPDYATFALIGSGSAYPLSGTYKQTADIDFSGVLTWTPIGTAAYISDTTNCFSGSFDGSGYKIRNINLNLATGTGFGLFGKAYGATFKNIHTEGSITNNSAIGGIAEETQGSSFTNCSNAANLTNTGSLGAVAGICTAISNLNFPEGSAFIAGCWNTGNMTAPTQAAGICTSLINSSAITACYNTGAISSSASEGTSRVGGIVIYINGGTITACYNTGAITANEITGTANVGGIAGRTSSNNNSSITACYSTGALSASKAATKNIGGIAGEHGSTTTVTACYWKTGTGATYGLGSASSDTGTDKFASDKWPTTGTHTEWGAGDGSGSGKYWRSLGSWNGGTPVYPKLWFED